MSRSSVYVSLFEMLADMTSANGYSHTYTPVKSVDNSSATARQTPFISLHLGTSEAMEEGNTFLYQRHEVPVIVTARVKVMKGIPTKKQRTEIEYEEDIERSQVESDILKRYKRAEQEVDGCVFFEPRGEEEARKDSNKHDMYVKYTFTMRYKTLR